MANCGLLLNDGSSFVLLNDGLSAILLNDATCAFEPGQGVTPAAGARITGGTFTRKRWREFQAAMEAQRALEARATATKTVKTRKKALKVAALAEHAIAVAGVEHANELARLTAALEVATNARKLATTIVTVEQVALAIIADIEESDDDDAIVLLLS